MYLFVFPDSLDYLVQMYYDFLRFRKDCVDFRDPAVMNLPSANVNTSLLLAYESLAYEKPLVASMDNFSIGEYHMKTNIPYSSKWSVFLHHCAPNAGGSVRVNGSISFVNSYGHLDADLYPVLISTSAVILPLTIILLLAYSVRIARYARRLQKIQMLLILPLIVIMFSALLKIALLVHGNRSGEPSSNSSHFAFAMLMAIFYASARFVLFIAAHGVGVVYYHTSVAKILLMALYCFVYGIVVCLAQFFESQKDPFQQVGPFVISILSPAVNAAYFLWVMQALSRSSSLAATMRNRLKVDLFERLTTMFHVCAALAFIFASLDLLRADMSGARLWTIYWTFGFFSQLVYIGGLAVGLWVYRPTRHNDWLVYSEEASNNRDNTQEEEEKRKPRVDVTALETQLPGMHYASILSPSHRKPKPEHDDEDATETLADLDSTLPPRKRRTRNHNRGEDLRDAAQRTLLLASYEDSQTTSSFDS